MMKEWRNSEKTAKHLFRSVQRKESMEAAEYGEACF
jgi:hypothetical protein